MDRQGEALRLFGCRITQLREERQMTLDTLAARTGLNPAELAAIEAGQIDLPITTIFLLANVFGLSADQLLE